MCSKDLRGHHLYVIDVCPHCGVAIDFRGITRLYILAVLTIAFVFSGVIRLLGYDFLIYTFAFCAIFLAGVKYRFSLPFLFSRWSPPIRATQSGIRQVVGNLLPNGVREAVHNSIDNHEN
jgi:hypothetical protein